jgi:hypothetical protein
VISLLEIVFELFPPPDAPSVEKNIIPHDGLPSDPRILQYFIVLFLADPKKRKVEAEDPALAFVIVRFSAPM